jgi:hypothetical protein
MVDFMLNATAWMDVYASNMNNIYSLELKWKISLYICRIVNCKIAIKINKGCVTLCGLPIYIKNYLTAKEDLWKLKHFTLQKI